VLEYLEVERVLAYIGHLDAGVYVTSQELILK